MSSDFALWKWKGEPRISRGLCYLMQHEVMDISEVERLEVDAIHRELEDRFPGWNDPESTADYGFVCEATPVGITFSTYSAADREFFDWLLDFAERRGFELFDPQTEPVTAEDRAELERRLATLRAAECEERARKELPVVVQRAASGDARALVKLGTHYSFGEGVECNLDQAFDCYRRAAELGHPDGMFNLAACYRLGEGTEVNVEKAIYWYTRASDLGEVFAPFELGNLFAGSGGVEADLEQAAFYFRLARERGHQDASRRLREIGAEPPLEL